MLFHQLNVPNTEVMKLVNFEKGILKRIEELIKLVKTVYPTNCFYSQLGETTSTIVGYPDSDPEDVFRKSYFVFCGESYFPSEWNNLHIDINNMIEAIKDKVTGWELDDKNLYFMNGKSGSKFNIASIELDAEKAKDKVMGVVFGQEGDFECKEYSRVYGSDTFERLLDYQVLTLRPHENDLVDDVAVIVTRKCFPNIKKMNELSVTWKVREEEEIFDVVLHSFFLDKHPVQFFHFVKAVRC